MCGGGRARRPAAGVFQAMDMTSLPLDEVMESWSTSMSPVSVRGIPMLNSEAFNLLMLA